MGLKASRRVTVCQIIGFENSNLQYIGCLLVWMAFACWCCVCAYVEKTKETDLGCRTKVASQDELRCHCLAYFQSSKGIWWWISSIHQTYHDLSLFGLTVRLWRSMKLSEKIQNALLKVMGWSCKMHSKVQQPCIAMQIPCCYVYRSTLRPLAILPLKVRDLKQGTSFIQPREDV